MMKRNLSVVLAMVCVTTVYAGEKVGSEASSEDARFAFLKKLAGKWAVESVDRGSENAHEPEKEGPAPGWEFMVTAGGNAVVERIMVGTPMEMMTVYHMNGPKLVATHYCMIGNQPHYTASKKLKRASLTFTCNGKVSNTSSHDDHHMHELSMRLGDNGKLYLHGEAFKDGKMVEKAKFVLARKKDARRS